MNISHSILCSSSILGWYLTFRCAHLQPSPHLNPEVSNPIWDTIPSPLYTYLRVFKCLCYPKATSTIIYKLAYHSSVCVYLVPSSNHHGYKCLNLLKHKVFILCHVTLNESHFHFGCYILSAITSYFYYSSFLWCHPLGSPSVILSFHFLLHLLLLLLIITWFLVLTLVPTNQSRYLIPLLIQRMSHFPKVSLNIWAFILMTPLVLFSNQPPFILLLSFLILETGPSINWMWKVHSFTVILLKLSTCVNLSGIFIPNSWIKGRAFLGLEGVVPSPFLIILLAVVLTL